MKTADLIVRMGEQVDSVIYHTRDYEKNIHVWCVQLKHVAKSKEKQIEIKIEVNDPDLDFALDTAWEKLNKALDAPHPRIKLMPAVEQKPIHKITKRPELDDEIPF